MVESKILFIFNALTCVIFLPLLLALAILVNIKSNKPISKWLSSVLFRLSQSPYCPLIIIFLHLLLCIGFVIINGWPIPQGHDDNSWVLMAQTFLEGKVTNPPPQFISHFDTFHVLFFPTYASKFPFGQGLVLSMGYLLFKQYIIGNWIINSLNLYLLYLILRNFTSRIWALCGLLIFSLHPRFLVADQSYWCIALSFTPALLFLYGMINKSSASMNPWLRGFLLAFSFFLASITRPFENLTLLISTSAFLILYTRIKIDIRTTTSFFLFSTIFFSTHLFYNKAITGNMFKMPYALHTEQYQQAPIFKFQKSVKHTYTSPDIQKFYDSEIDKLNNSLSIKSQILGLIYTLNQTTAFIQLNPVLLLGFILYITHYRRNTKNYDITITTIDALLLGILTSLLFILAISNYADDHYTASFWPSYVIISIKGLGSLRSSIRNRITLAFSSTIFFCCLVTYIDYYTSHKHEIPASHKLDIIKSTHVNTLYLVSYSDDHNPLYEWVYNNTNPMDSPIIFARYLKNNTSIMNHFRNKGYKIVHLTVFNDFTPPKREIIVP